MVTMSGQKGLGITHLDDIELFATTTEVLPILIREANSFMENPSKSAPFHALTFYTSAKTFLPELRAVFVEYCTFLLCNLLSVERAYVLCAYHKHSPATHVFRLRASAQL